ncbi:MAG TPA: ABC transporter permease [Jatrophihabitans sp.]|nr:ABC transporter permease [Jatrophihabitans sp.]
MTDRPRTGMAYRRYLRHEIRRTFRNRKFFLFSLAIPLVLYYVMTAGHTDDRIGTLHLAAYYMVSLAVWGAVTGVVAAGSRISAERDAGWNRQLRLTALRPFGYFTTKTVTAYLVAIPTLVALYAAGAADGVTMDAAHWATMIGWVLLGLLPFAALGIVLGLILNAEAMGPALVGVMVVVGLLGGIWTPVESYPAWLQALCHALPSYWITHAGQSALTGQAMSAQGGLVLAAWTGGIVVAGAHAYRRSTRRS